MCPPTCLPTNTAPLPECHAFCQHTPWNCFQTLLYLLSLSLSCSMIVTTAPAATPRACVPVFMRSGRRLPRTSPRQWTLPPTPRPPTAATIGTAAAAAGIITTGTMTAAATTTTTISTISPDTGVKAGTEPTITRGRGNGNETAATNRGEGDQTR